MRVCDICEQGNFENVEDIVMEIEGYLFVMKGDRCTSCRQEIPYELEAKKTIAIAQRLGVWPEPMKLYRHLSRSGGGLVFRIPADLERQLHLDEKTEIAISKVGNKIVVEQASEE